MKLLFSTFAWAILCLTGDIGTASAQQADRVYRIGWLWVGVPNEVPPPMEKWSGSWMPFREALRENGFVLGKNLSAEIRTANGDIGQLQAQAAALVAANVDVIVTPGTPATLAAMQATKSIPIVFPGVGGPIEKGIVASLAKPGGNVTGMAVNVESHKMWDLLKEIAPATRRVGTLSNARNSEGMAPERVQAFRAKVDADYKVLATSLGMDSIPIRVSVLGDIDPALDALAKSGGAGLVVLTDATLFSWRTSIMEIARRYRLVTACQQSFEWAQEGCVITYGELPLDIRRGAALQVAKILRGMKPIDIPVEQPTKFKLFINAKAANELGLTIPPSILASADEVIE
jgi:putative tryptophan/tyrosine transport system substrate-binding protein